MKIISTCRVRFLSQTSSELQKAKPLPRLLVGLLTLQDIFYLPIKKNAAKSLLVDQRQRQGLRQRLRRVNKPSAARQPRRRRWFCDFQKD